MPSSDSYKEIESFFAAPLTTRQKAWLLIDKFYHLILSHMADKSITRSQLARKLDRSKSSVSQMFNKTPNISILKMVEIADAVGVRLDIVDYEKQRDLEQQKVKNIYTMVTYTINPQENELQYKKTPEYTSFRKNSTYSTSQTCRLN